MVSMFITNSRMKVPRGQFIIFNDCNYHRTKFEELVRVLPTSSVEDLTAGP